MAYSLNQEFGGRRLAVDFRQHLGSAAGMLLSINNDLERNSSALAVNETFLVAQLESIATIPITNEKIYWLTVARINELALFCAGNYADSGEFQAAGDLLVNPRLILLHFRGCSRPISKIRHLALSEQFAFAAESAGDTLCRLGAQADYEVKKPPILPMIHQMLRESGCICRNYLDSTTTRMKQIADVISLIASWQLDEDIDLHQRLQSASKSDRRFILSRLCRFDHEIFQKIGEDIRQLLHNDHYLSTFLVG